MIIDMAYWTRVLKRLLYVVFVIIGLLLAFKLSIFYMPFLIAFIISLIIEPLIKKIMKNLGLSRRVSSIIIFVIVLLIIVGLITWGIVTLITEASHLSQDLNKYIEKIYVGIQYITNSFNKIHLPMEITSILQNSTNDLIEMISQIIKNILNGFLNFITNIPNIAIYLVITIMSLYLICVDRIYILDQIEHHFPKKWVNKLGKHIREITKILGSYLKAEAILILVSFIISLIGLYILKFAKFNIDYPLLIAIFIGFVDALPILGSGTVMVPWAVISALNGDLSLGIAIIVLLIVMSIVRQFLEPKLVSKHIGTHPIFTLIAMYTGFKILGVLGLFLGPIILVIIKNVFSVLIDEGVVKTIFDRK